ncbi:carbamate kinase [Thermovirga sp.]|uniref:carbamate kinase n=1 Tax=Thermovirga sp. TaxID=2699834 RepID=UPI0026007B7E|nr:carbamate kinase [Thermovirga sp.]MBO8153299.1 carbamate kinase [Thermovirga sp.]
MVQRVVVALGGNAILQRGQKGTAEEQMANVMVTARQIVEMLEKGYEVVVSHGNGPQVGAILIQNELGSKQVPPMPMDVCGAESQGLIGYMLSQAIDNLLKLRNIEDHRPVCFVTRVEVDPNDEAFKKPTKPVGPFYSEEVARQRMEEKGETWINDAGRGWRRVVPSPNPLHIVEAEPIKDLVERGYTVIASGGGGIPVVRDSEGLYKGVEAVIDKDLASERLAQEVNADVFMILTDVPKVALNYGKPDETWLGHVSADELSKYQEEGHFKAGSMGPKVAAALRFVKNGGKKAIIASLNEALQALKGEAGTQITA